MFSTRRIVIALCGLALLGSGSPVLAQAPKDIVLMLDNSGSMIKNDPDFLSRVAVRRFLDQVGADTRVAFVIFDERARVAMPLTPVDDVSRPRFLAALDTIDYKGQLTNSPAALEKSIYALRTDGRPQAEHSIVFMTDGIVDTGNREMDVERARWMRDELASDAAEAGIRIFGVAFTDNADFLLIQSLARKTRGAYYRALDPGDIDGVFDRIVTALDTPLAIAGTTERAGPVASIPVAPIPVEPVVAAPTLPERPPALPEAPADPAPATLAEPEPEPEPRVATGPPPAKALPPADAPAPPQLEPAAPAATLPALPTVDSSSEIDGGASLPSLSGAGQPAEAPALPTLPTLPTLPETPVSEDTPPPDPPVLADAGDAATGSSEPRASAEPAPPPPASAATASFPIPAAALIASAFVLLLLVVGVVAMLLRRRRAAAKPAVAAMPKAFLNDLGGATERPSYELTNKLTIVGRLKGPDADVASYIVIDEATIGRRHAMIEYREHSFWVSDQNSLNGTFVNNARIDAEQRLKHGDRLRFHKHEFEFLVLEMFETDRTMISDTVFAELASGIEEGDDDTIARGRADVTTDPGTSTAER